VRLTPLLDQGAEAQGPRFVQDKQRGRYDDLATLLYDLEEAAAVLLGGPGSGKTTLLRHLQWQRTQAELTQPGLGLPGDRRVVRGRLAICDCLGTTIRTTKNLGTAWIRSRRARSICGENNGLGKERIAFNPFLF
jgi:hypothetical protein